MKTRLSVNVNKIALIRNARGNDYPNLVKISKDIEAYGAEGITVHPRPDERHITYADIPVLKAVTTTEFNIEGNPRTQKFMDLVLANTPNQCTLVPDAQNALTSDSGWDTITHEAFLTETIGVLKAQGIRVSILNLDNLRYFQEHVPNLLEVSIGHALVVDSLYYGLQNTIQMYLECLTIKD